MIYKNLEIYYEDVDNKCQHFFKYTGLISVSSNKSKNVSFSLNINPNYVDMSELTEVLNYLKKYHCAFTANVWNSCYAEKFSNLCIENITYSRTFNSQAVLQIDVNCVICVVRHLDEKIDTYCETIKKDLDKLLEQLEDIKDIICNIDVDNFISEDDIRKIVREELRKIITEM